jgi:hypothetical protein
MTTAREVRKLVAPLLARNPDLGLVGRLIVVKPIRHVLCGVFIDATSSANQYQPQWLMTILLFRMDDITYGIGERLFRSGKSGLWRLDDQEASDDLTFVIERDALPRLRSVKTLEDFLEAILPKDPRELKIFWGTRFIITLALGNLDAASELLTNDLRRIYIGKLNDVRSGLGDRLLQEGAQVSAADRRALIDYLHDCEDYTAGKLKLGSLWERTPFPIESQ